MMMPNAANTRSQYVILPRSCLRLMDDNPLRLKRSESSMCFLLWWW